ncbi:MAG: serine/threonine-protein kinase [Planctomycetota bacterium]
MSDLVSGYNIIRKLGEGARSQVYHVVKPETGQVFALKRVIREKHEDCRFLDQAIREYEVSSRLNHAYLRKAYELKRIRTVLRLSEVQVVMEFVDGVSLDKHRPDRIDATVELFLMVAEGLNAMHEDQLLHTDIKPNNILVTADSIVKIIDYGQSCQIGFRKPRIQGTPDYIAPEQVERRHLTKQTDVFNLGATLYWALTGTAYPTMITKQGKRSEKADMPKRVPTPQELNPEIPTALSKLVMQSCAHEPSRRPRDMKEVISRLEMLHHVLTKRRKAGHDLSTAIRDPGDAPPPPEDDAVPDSDDSYDFSGFIREIVEDEAAARKEKDGEGL